MHVFADYHTHTIHSHGRGTVAENVAAAAKLGLEAIAISDHGPNHLFHYGIKNLQVLEVIRRELASACAAHPGVRGLVAIEANIISVKGDLDLPPEHRGLVDLVLANIHSMVLPHSLKDAAAIWGFHYGKRVWPSFGRRSVVVNTEATVKALERNKIDILTHPGLRFAIDYRVVVQACAHYGTAFEINTSKAYLRPEIIELAAEEGAAFVISSDAHVPQRVGDFQLGLELAKQVGLTAEEILNARDS
ncbi:MAG: PHP domain-containing protein [Firmicutes bacterium]|jgi:putative hydrolase|nr:PHP domain-containing protein [Bacillota bacterium]NLO65972.1 PHP domain-containing protein [Bacillota bacterium]